MKALKAGVIATTLGLSMATAFAGPRDVPSDTTDEDSQQVDTYESMGKPHLGVMVTSLTPELRSFFGAPRESGLLVAHVEPGSPAQRAGIRVGDVLTQVKGRRIQSADDVVMALSQAEGQGRIQVDFIRDRKPMRTQASILSDQQLQQQRQQQQQLEQQQLDQQQLDQQQLDQRSMQEPSGSGV
jgi:S1-C subfamily serine protease